MINIVLACDDKDAGDEENLGLDYFYIACAEHAANLFAEMEKNLVSIRGEDLNMTYVNEMLSSLNNKNFIFIAYSHGSSEALLYNNQKDAYVAKEKNTYLFKGSLFYTWSCLCGQELGLDLVANGCHTFLGYDDDIWAGTGETDHFVECANYGLKKLIGGSTVKEAYNEVEEEYTKRIDHFDEVGDYMIASFFRRNRDALVLYGDGNITLERFEY